MSLRDVTREFVNGDVVTKVLRGVNLDVYEGEFLVLLGESGCGKSTLLNIIGGMDSATSGTIECLGQDLTSATQKELTEFRRQNLGFIFQSYNLISRLTSFRNLTLITELVDEPMDVDDRTPTDDKRPPRRQDPPSVASYFLTLPKSSQAKDGPRGARNTWKGAHRRLTGPTHDGRDVGLSGSLDRPAPFSNARRPFCVCQPRGTV